MSVESDQTTALRCANHPNTETHLRCSRCGKPICVRCVIQTPVGGRCRECAQLKKAPIMIVSPMRYARAALFGLAAALVGGFIWASVGGMFSGFFSLILLALLGYVVGEAVSRGAEGRISRGLTIMAGGFTLLGIVVGQAGVVLTRFGGQIPLNVALGIGVNSLFSNLMVMLFAFLAIVVAVDRIR